MDKKEKNLCFWAMKIHNFCEKSHFELCYTLEHVPIIFVVVFRDIVQDFWNVKTFWNMVGVTKNVFWIWKLLPSNRDTFSPAKFTMHYVWKMKMTKMLHVLRVYFFGMVDFFKLKIFFTSIMLWTCTTGSFSEREEAKNY